MADRQVLPSNTFEEFRQTFNSTAEDVGDITNILNATGVIANATDVVDCGRIEFKRNRWKFYKHYGNW